MVALRSTMPCARWRAFFSSSAAIRNSMTGAGVTRPIRPFKAAFHWRARRRKGNASPGECRLRVHRGRFEHIHRPQHAVGPAAAREIRGPVPPLDRRHEPRSSLRPAAAWAGFSKLVVLKTILPDIGGEEDFVRMFLDEARITAAFNHPHIAQVYELDIDRRRAVHGDGVRAGLHAGGDGPRLSPGEGAHPHRLHAAAVRDTALALHYAHTFTDPRGRKQTRHPPRRRREEHHGDVRGRHQAARLRHRQGAGSERAHQRRAW